MEREEFEKLVSEGYERLPEWVREKIKNVALLVEDEPSTEDRKEQGLAECETLLGLYKGIPLSERGEQYGVGMTLPDTITLYQRPIEESAEEELHNDIVSRYNDLRYRYKELFSEHVRQIVADTVWHEFAHHFGMNEGEVRDRERHRKGS